MRNGLMQYIQTYETTLPVLVFRKVDPDHFNSEVQDLYLY